MKPGSSPLHRRRSDLALVHKGCVLPLPSAQPKSPRHDGSFPSANHTLWVKPTSFPAGCSSHPRPSSSSTPQPAFQTAHEAMPLRASPITTALNPKMAHLSAEALPVALPHLHAHSSLLQPPHQAKGLISCSAPVSLVLVKLPSITHAALPANFLL